MPLSSPVKDPEPAHDGALWDFAIDVYGQGGVATACLALQDDFGMDVSLLLFAAWIGETRGLTLTPEQAAVASGWTQAWRTEVVRPLRAVRRHLAAGHTAIPGAPTEDLRDTIKAAELAAERIEMAWLQQQASLWPRGRGAEAARRNLKTVFVQTTGCALDDHSARHLAAINGAVLRRRTQERA